MPDHRHVMKWGGYRSSIAKTKAIIVVGHAILVIIWNVLATGKPYDELGADYFTRRLHWRSVRAGGLLACGFCV